MVAPNAHIRPALFHDELLRVESTPESVMSPTSTSGSSSSLAAPFLLRSKSDLTMSSLPTLAGVRSSSSEVSLAASAHSPRSASVAQVREEKSVGLARALLSKSSRLLAKTRSSNRLRSMDNFDGSEVQRPHTRDSSSAKSSSRHTRFASSGKSEKQGQSLMCLLTGEAGPPQRGRPAISEPYNFQHLTHTGPTQARTLRTASPRELVTEFSAIRASQAPKPELKGIKAEDIQSTFSPAASPSLSTTATSFDSPTESRPTSSLASPASSEEFRTLRTVKSIDSFTRVSTNSFSSPKPPISPPPRRSSRQIHGLSHSLSFNPASIPSGSPTIPDAMTPNSNTSSPEAYFSMSSSFFSLPCSGALHHGPGFESGDIAQAVTTPDDSAYLFITQQRSGSNIGLADVPEEEEEEGPKHDAKDGTRSYALRHANSFPCDRILIPPVSERMPWSTPEPEDEGWATSPAPSPTFPPRKQAGGVSSRPTDDLSTALAGHSSWEDDIDYCYEHAMEAEGSEYDRSSAEDSIWMNATSSSTPTAAFNSLQDAQTKPPRSLYLHNFPSSPMDTGSATSSISIPGIRTPSDPESCLELPSSESTFRFALAPSLLIHRDYASRVTHEETYTQNLVEQDSFKQAAYFHQPQDLRVATDFSRHALPSHRSPASPISKPTSHESLSTDQRSSAGTSTSKHRRSSSYGSLPDLVPGTASRIAASEQQVLPIQHTAGKSYEPYEPSILPRSLQTVRPRTSSPDLLAGSSVCATLAPASMPTAPVSAPSVTETFAARARTNSEATKPVMPDLALIGAPKGAAAAAAAAAGAWHGSGSGTTNAGRRALGRRTSYSLFPQGSMSSLKGAAAGGVSRMKF
ncbi:MAG: hypothetical protein LQ340_003070 [Diploschistes diacapsis]|nr:MAG: hypothetical protein LQ340_003070 [Diploschistes diacapsis]